MNVTLDTLTIGQFVDILCGDVKILRMGDPRQVSETVRTLVYAYRDIADPNGARAYLSDYEELTRAKTTETICLLCQILVGFGKFEEVKAIFADMGVDFSRMKDSRIAAELKGRLKKAENAVARLEAEMSSPEREIDIRRSFDEQTAALMAHFKFQIDMNVMKATIYAHLVARFQREMKAQTEALKKYRK